MAEIGNKFIFTTEGRTSLVAQLGGIRFSVLGAVLIQGLKPVEVPEDKKDTTFEDAFKNLTLESLSLDNGVVLGLKNVDYSALGNQKIYPVALDSYQSAVNNITQNLIPLHYVPAQEVEDTIGNVYGIYELDVDQTLLSCNFVGDDSDVSFAHIGLIGKQYTQTDDATYNVDHTQKPILVGIAQLDGDYDEETNVYEGGIQLLAEQNQYVNIKLKLRFTLDERDRDIALAINTEDPDTRAVLAISDKLSLVNNGLKTKAKEGVKVAADKSIIENFNLNKEGALATDKTLMVAETYNADELENEWNGVGLIHLINRENQEDDDENPYTPQVVLSTIEHYENLETEPVVSYNVMMLLQGKGKDVPTINLESKYEDIVAEANEAMGQETTGVAYQEQYFKINGTECPKFVMSTKPEYDNIAVDIFGLNNNILDDGNPDKFLFTKNNVSHVNDINAKLDENIIIGGNNNLVEARHSNALINSWYNVTRNECEDNTIINSDSNILQKFTDTCVVLNSNYNTFNINALLPDYEFDWWYDNIRLTTVINSSENNIHKVKKAVLLNANNNLINAGVGCIGEGCEPSENISIIGGEYNSVYNCNNLYILGSYHRVFMDNTDFEDGINKRTLILGQNSDWNWSTMRNWKSRPGIIYGNGNENGSNERNALEFFPDEGLLKLYDKSGNSTVTIGGDVGIKVDNTTNFNMDMKSLNLTDKLLLSKGNKSITLSTVDTENIVVSDGDSQNTLKYKSSNNILTLNGHGYEGNYSNSYLNFKWNSYTAQIDPSEFRIDSQVNTTPNRMSITDTGLVISKSNKPVVTINNDTYYQKARVDILCGILYGVSNIINAKVTYYKGPAELGAWFRTLWESAPPIAWCDDDDDKKPRPNEAIYCCKYNGDWKAYRLDENDTGSYTNKIAWSVFETLVANNTNNYSHPYKWNNDNSKFFYMISTLPEITRTVDEIEINLYIDDIVGMNIGLLWNLQPYNSWADSYGPMVKLNVILSNGLFGNGEGEDFYYWKCFNATSKSSSDSPTEMDYERISLTYDKPLTLVSRPLYTSVGTPTTNIGPANKMWGWYRYYGY
jgi:hypothetical protein